MFRSKLQLAGFAIIGAACFVAGASAEGPKSADRATASALSAENFAKLHQLLLPHEGELQWMAVPWRTSITLARHQAAAADKPLLIFADTGAGFADALGLC